MKVGTFQSRAKRNDETTIFSDMGKSVTLLLPHGARNSNIHSGYHDKNISFELETCRFV